MVTSLLTGGLYAVRLTVRRCDELSQVLLMFTLVENDLSYSLTPFVSLVTALSQNQCLYLLDFLPRCVLLCGEGVDFPAAWQRAVNESRALLSGRERQTLMQFASLAGTTDAKGQMRLCKAYSEELERSKEKSEAFRKKYTGLFFALGILLAALAAVALW